MDQLGLGHGLSQVALGPLLDELRKFFSEETLRSALRRYVQSSVSISFTKAKEGLYQIVAGIVRIEPHCSYETRFTYRPQSNQLTSNCNCENRTEGLHCLHVVLLYLYWIQQQKQQEKLLTTTDQEQALALLNPYPSMSEGQHLFHGPGVVPENFGTIIGGPNKFFNAKGGYSYSNNQYRLTNGSHTHFPTPQPFYGKLIFHFDAHLQLTLRHQEHAQEHKLTREISLFESLYLFNWNNGQALQLPETLYPFLDQMRANKELLSVTDYCNLITEHSLSHFCDIMVDQHYLSELKKNWGALQVEVTPTKNSNLMTIHLSFVHAESQVKFFPERFRFFAAQNGLLEFFPQKKLGLDFLERVFNFLLEKEHLLYRPRGAINAQYLVDCFYTLKNLHHLQYYHLADHQLYEASSGQLIKTLAIFRKLYGINFFRFSTFNRDKGELVYTIPYKVIFESLPHLCHELEELNIPIFYQRQKIEFWHPSLLIERNYEKQDWLELNLQIDLDDLEIIKQFAKENSPPYLFHAHKLVLLNNNQKDILNFINAYVLSETTTHAENNRESVNADVGNKRTIGLTLHKNRIFELYELNRLGIAGALTAEEEQVCQSLLNVTEIPNYPIPADLRIRPWGYQEVGFRWIRFLYEHRLGACLADDMGLGKTLQAIIFLRSIIDTIEKVLIICPVSLILNWEKEFQKSLGFGNQIEIYHGGDRTLGSAKIIITSYGVMKKEIEATFSQQVFDVIIFDEIQSLKNAKSLGAMAARKLNGRFRVALTGTPLENNLNEFFNIIDLCVPGIWNKLFNLKKNTASDNFHDQIKRLVRPFVLRRVKSEVLSDLPPKIINIIPLPFSNEEKQIYLQSLLAARGDLLKVERSRRHNSILKNLLKLRQLCLWQPIKVNTSQETGDDEERPSLPSHTFLSSKIAFLIETLEQIMTEGHQTLIFSQFTTYLDLIQQEFIRLKWSFSRIDGSMSARKRQNEIDKFQSGSHRIFLISLKAGGVGLNLTAASYIFLMDPWWNPAVEEQAIDRAHRIGQTNKVTIYKLIIKDSVEEKVLKLQDQKRELFKSLMFDEEGSQSFFSANLCAQDFEELLLL